MYTGTTIFSQVMQHLPWHGFHRIVQHYRGDYKVKSFRCADHYRVMAFAQLTYRESLRDIEACLRAMRSKLFHMGIRSTVSRNNLSNANERRDWRIYAEFAQVLIAEARRRYTDEDLLRYPSGNRLCSFDDGHQFCGPSDTCDNEHLDNWPAPSRRPLRPRFDTTSAHDRDAAAVAARVPGRPSLAGGPRCRRGRLQIQAAPGERPSTRRCAAARDRHHPERNLPISGPAGSLRVIFHTVAAQAP